MSAPQLLPAEFASQLHQLLAAFGRQGSGHLTEVDADLRQTSYLLAEAVTKLGNSFIGIHAATMAQSDLIAMMKDGAPVPPSLRAMIDRLQLDAVECVNEAITALQFQDMTNQLIGRIVGHVASLHQVLQDAGAAGALLSHNPDNAQALLVLASVNQVLQEKGTILDQVPYKAVTQTHMESGDIELF